MKSIKRLLAFLVFCYVQSFAFGQKTNIVEAFDSLKFNTKKTWRCDTSKFVSLHGKLASNSHTVNDFFGISMPIAKRTSAEWAMDIQLPFATSSTNYVEYYLWADSVCLHNSSHGYFIRFGDTKDQMVFYEMNEGTLNKIGASEFGITHALSGSITCVLDSTNSLRVSFYDSSKALILWEDAFDSVRFDGVGNTGLAVKQSTNSFHFKHRFDNLYYGVVRGDSLAPNLLELVVVNERRLELYFDESVDSNDLKSSNFTLAPDGNLPEKVQVNKQVLYLDFSESFHTRAYTLIIDSIADSLGNKQYDLATPFNYVNLDTGDLHDILLTEIYADPSPSVGLPPYEYVELTNRSKKIIELEAYVLSDMSRESMLGSYHLYPDSSVVLVDASSKSYFQQIPNVLPVVGLISLNNNGDSLRLKNADGLTIHEVNYSVDWHSEEWKKAGGWSLEMKDLSQACIGDRNWSSSKSFIGGTPGSGNSIKEKIEDNQPPLIIDIDVQGSIVTLTFDESLLYYQVAQRDFYMESNDIIEVVKINSHQVKITCLEPFINGQTYVLSVDGIEDCSGNILDHRQFAVAIGGVLTEHDLLLNELMFDVSENCAEFIEVYNPSSRIYNLKDVYVGVKESQGGWENLWQVTNRNVMLMPDSFVVITKDSLALKTCKPSTRNVLQNSKLPSLVNAGGVLGICDQHGNFIDTFAYHDDFHFPLLASTKDVSLERIVPNPILTNWTSAAQSANYATPGFQNSQMRQANPNKSQLSIHSDPVSPNEDGYNDRLIVSLNTEQSNALVHVRIFDQVGRLVAFPVNTSLVGVQNQFVWDCLNIDGYLVSAGIYILHIEMLTLTGEHEVYKKAFTVVR